MNVVKKAVLVLGLSVSGFGISAMGEDIVFEGFYSLSCGSPRGVDTFPQWCVATAMENDQLIHLLVRYRRLPNRRDQNPLDPIDRIYRLEGGFGFFDNGWTPIASPIYGAQEQLAVWIDRCSDRGVCEGRLTTKRYVDGEVIGSDILSNLKLIQTIMTYEGEFHSEHSEYRIPTP